jgi:glucosamine--fructose-6-phosphate aminotransferase (isomerizing)
VYPQGLASSSNNGQISLVHNGIIENANQLRTRLKAHDITFNSETDSEVLVHLIASIQANSLAGRVKLALQQIEGAYGLAMIDAERPGEIVIARNGSPVVLGIGEKEMLVASDAAALVRHT